MRINHLLFSLICIPGAVALAESECINLYTRGDYTAAFPKCADEATDNQATPDVWFYLGHMYDNGDGTATDAGEAFIWYEKAAGANHPKAQYNLAVAYLQGRGTSPDEGRAISWLNKAAANGDIDAPEVLAAYYMKNSQYEQAVIWLIAANRAKPGNRDTEYDLAVLLLKGQGTKQNIPAGIKYMELSATHGHQAAIKKMGFISYDKSYGTPNLEKAYFWWLLYTRIYPEYASEVEESISLSHNNLSREAQNKIAADVEEWMKKYPVKNSHNITEDISTAGDIASQENTQP